MSVAASVRAQLADVGLAAFPAERVKAALGPVATSGYRLLAESFQDLVRDRFMGDGGRYRLRRYSRFRLSSGPGGALVPLEDHSILQSTEDNALNGGIRRTFEPLRQEVGESPLLRALIEHDAGLVAAVEPELFQNPVLVGVHQVRIVALPGQSGKPTPEGVHRDAERYTFQHLWARRGVEGGEFRAYDGEKRPTFAWLQEEPFDSVLFLGTTWHSATPVRCRPGETEGVRDIFLIDFDPE